MAEAAIARINGAKGDYYKVLDVEKDANVDAIKKAYRSVRFFYYLITIYLFLLTASLIFVVLTC
jgi:hypothetical protein